jgi:tetratricopeptide (TPR) repeat protein
VINNTKNKARVLYDLARCMKIQKQLQVAREMGWRALDYALFSRDRILEFDIYDLLGRIYYLEGKIDEATYYHKKSMNADPDASVNLIEMARANCLNNMKKRMLIVKNLSLEVLYHMDCTSSFVSLIHQSLQEDQQRLLGHFFAESLGQKPLKSLKVLSSLSLDFGSPIFIISSDVTFQSQIHQIKTESEFSRTPIEPSIVEEKKKLFGKLKERFQKEMELETKITRMAFAKQQVKKSQETFFFVSRESIPRKPPIFTRFPHKKSIDEQVEEIKKRDLSETDSQRFSKILRAFPRVKLGEQIGKKYYISHLSPNRSIFEFDQHFNPDYSMINTFFQEAFLLFVLPD